jgi:capsid protein
MNDVYESVGNIYGVKKTVDGRKDENELLVKSNNWVRMVSRAKNFVRNVPIATAVKITFENYCGCLTPVEGNEESRTAFNEWAKKAGMESGQSLVELTAQLVGVMTWGDCLVVLGSDPYALPGTISARLKLVDPLRVETPPQYKDKGLVGGKKVVLGVVLDKQDIEIGYYVRKAGTDGHKDSDFTFLPRYDKNGRFFSMLVRAPGSAFPGQVRSFPMLSGSMNVADILNQLISSAAVEAKTKSTVSVMLETEFPPEDSNKEFADSESEEKNASEPPRLNIDKAEPGDVLTLPPGSKPHVITNGGNLELVEQIKQQIKIIAGSIGIPYAALMSDFEKMSFSSSKMMMSKLYRLIELWNYGPIMRLFSEIYKWVCYEHHLLKGVLPTKEMLECQWVGPSQPDPDPMKSAKADLILAEKGYKLPADVVAERYAQDWATYLDAMAAQIKMAKEKLGDDWKEIFGKKASEKDDEDDDEEEDEE